VRSRSSRQRFVSYAGSIPNSANVILHAIRELAKDPRLPGVKALQGRTGHRLRVCDHRVLYTVNDARIEVWIVKAGHRRDVCR
jgi:mRNA interferase RelE/StbE